MVWVALGPPLSSLSTPSRPYAASSLRVPLHLRTRTSDKTTRWRSAEDAPELIGEVGLGNLEGWDRGDGGDGGDGDNNGNDVEGVHVPPMVSRGKPSVPV